MSCDKSNCAGCDCGKDYPFVNTPDIDKTVAEEMPDDNDDTMLGAGSSEDVFAYTSEKSKFRGASERRIERNFWRKLDKIDDDVKIYSEPGTVVEPLVSENFQSTSKTDPIQQSYEKNIICEKFSDFVNNEFSLVLSLDEILKKYYRIAELKMQIQPLKNVIDHLTKVHDQLNKLHLSINYHNEVDPTGIDTESLETAPKIVRVPNHTDELILLATTGMNVRELSRKCTSVFEKLKRTIEKYNTNASLINDMSSELYEDNWNECFFNKIILERVRDGKIQWSNVNFAIKIVTTGYEGFKTPKMVIGLAYNRIGQKLCHTLDFISPLDEFSMETSLNNLLDAYEKTVKTTKEGN